MVDPPPTDPRRGEVPVPRRALVPRPRLTDRLALSPTVRPRLVLVSAPAGFGKTTVLTQWLGAEEADGTVGAWVSLDPHDSDVRLFLSRVVGALADRIEGFGAQARAWLESGHAPPVEAVVGSLVTELDEQEAPTVVALDDYHVIDTQVVHDAVAYLIENLPPRASVAIATRSDPPLPLARWRSRGELVELRASDLRFSTDEAGEFLNGVMGLDLVTEQVAALDGRTEGWAAGLQLAGLSLRSQDDPERFVKDFAGSHRFVLDYLVEEVLDGQPEDVRKFLLYSSVLPRLTAGLCRGRDRPQ